MTAVEVTLAAYGLKVCVAAGAGYKVVEDVQVPTVESYEVVTAGFGVRVVV